MKTILQDPQLDYELQELYILSNHWISDIHFEEDEIRFLKKVINDYLLPGLKNEQLNKIVEFNKTLTQEDVNISSLKSKITELLKFIGSLINDSNSEVSIDLIEKFAVLEAEMKTLFESVKQVKKLLFSFSEEVMKTECNIFTNQIDHQNLIRNYA
jgi:hypothetical protein